MSDEPFKPCLCGNIGIAEWNARNKDAVAKEFRRGRRPKKVCRDE